MAQQHLTFISSTHSRARHHRLITLPFISPLFELPAEIRNTIYKYVLGGNSFVLTEFVLFSKSGFGLRHSIETTEESDRPEIAMIRVNRQAHTEASLLLYSTNTFNFMSLRALETFIEQSSERQRNAVRQLGLRTQRGEYMVFRTPGDDRKMWSFLSAFGGLTRVEFTDVTFVLEGQEGDEVLTLGKAARMMRVHTPGLQIHVRQAAIVRDSAGRLGWGERLVDL